MPDYTYRFYDLLTRALLEELPVGVTSLPSRLSASAQTTVTLALGDRRIAVKDWRTATKPGHTLMVADRGGSVVWAGIPWRRAWTKSTKTATLTVATARSYLDQRFITADANYTEDKLAIARDLIRVMQAPPGGNIGIGYGAELANYTDTAIYTGSQLTRVGDAVDTLAEAEPGFDYDIACSYDAGGVPRLLLRLGAPQLGRHAGRTVKTSGGQPVAPSLLVFQLPGSIQDYTFTEDAQAAAVTVWSVGQPTGAVDLYGSASDPTALDEGYPLLEQRQDYPDIALQAKLDTHAAGALRKLRVPVETASWVVLGAPGPGHPGIGEYQLGDAATFRVTDEFYPAQPDGSPGLVTRQRITGIDIAPPQGQGVELVTLSTSQVVG